MIKINLMIVLTLGLSLVGCASSGPTHKNYTSSDAACIEGDVANFFKFFSDGEAHVHIRG